MIQTNSPKILKDSFNRVARKLRISVIDKCNTKCIYYMSNVNINWFDDKEILNFQEVIRIASIFTYLSQNYPPVNNNTIY